MTSTPELVSVLTTNLKPVRRLRPPLVRACRWLSLAVLVSILMAIGRGFRPDLLQHLEQTLFTVGLAGSLTTGVLAAFAAFMVSLPDRSRRWMLLPLPPLAIWLSTIGYQCLTKWVSISPAGMQLGETARCFATLVLISLPLSLSMFAMLRYTVHFRPTNVILLGSLAVAGITATALALLHPLDATVMILVFNLGAAFLIVGIGGALGLSLGAGNRHLHN